MNTLKPKREAVDLHRLVRRGDKLIYKGSMKAEVLRNNQRKKRALIRFENGNTYEGKLDGPFEVLPNSGESS